MAFRIQLFSYGGHAPVHHVAGGHHIGAGPDMGQGGFGQKLQGGVVKHVLPLNEAAVTVVCVFTQTNIGYHQNLRKFFLYHPYSLLHNTVVVISSGAGAVLLTGNTKKH